MTVELTRGRDQSRRGESPIAVAHACRINASRGIGDGERISNAGSGPSELWRALAWWLIGADHHGADRDRPGESPGQHWTDPSCHLLTSVSGYLPRCADAPRSKGRIYRLFSAPARIRTWDPRIRSPMLYPAELRGQCAPPLRPRPKRRAWPLSSHADRRIPGPRGRRERFSLIGRRRRADRRRRSGYPGRLAIDAQPCAALTGRRGARRRALKANLSETL